MIENETFKTKSEEISYKGNTPFGYYDNDPIIEKFVLASMKSMSLLFGHPITKLELTYKQIFSNMELSIHKYLTEMEKYSKKGHLIREYTTEFSKIDNYGKSWIFLYFKELCLYTLSMSRSRYKNKPEVDGHYGATTENTSEFLFHSSIDSLLRLEDELTKHFAT